MEMNERREKITQKINTLPKGSFSPSNKYWCVTCKKFFILDNPTCPFMTKMCVNTPIAIENFNPESSEGIERIGLFYPKFPQKLLSAAITKDYSKIGAALAKGYINFLKDWMIRYENQPMQTLKSFLIIISGVETAQRVNENKNKNDVSFEQYIEGYNEHEVKDKNLIKEEKYLVNELLFANEKLMDLLNRLPDEQKKIILLRYADDLDYKTIGSILNKNESAVRTMSFRALKYIKEELNK
ncbi:MAG: RNA polymerase sigma factor [Candidatus Humimicrobiaceae bacterium]